MASYVKDYTRNIGNIQVEKRKYNRNQKRVISIISYDPLWKTLKSKGITTYMLIKDYSFSKGTLDSLKQNRNISTATLNDICNMLECDIVDVIQFIPDKK